MELVLNEVEDKEIELKTLSNLEFYDSFVAKVGEGSTIRQTTFQF